jgi:hypothetical protein
MFPLRLRDEEMLLKSFAARFRARHAGAQLLAQTDAIGGDVLGPNSGSAGFSHPPGFLSRFRLILLDGRSAL